MAITTKSSTRVKASRECLRKKANFIVNPLPPPARPPWRETGRPFFQVTSCPRRPCPCPAMIPSHRHKPVALRSPISRDSIRARPTRGPIVAIYAKHPPEFVGFDQHFRFEMAMSCLRGAWQRQHCLKMTSSRLTCACHQLSARIKFTSGFNSFPQFTPLTSKILLPFFRKLCLSPRVPPPLEGRFGQSSRT